MSPKTKYAKAPDGVHLAYQVVGEGPTDIVFVMGWTTNIEAMWREPALEAFLTRLSSMGRLILFDRRGLGLSDRIAGDVLPTLETRMDDVRVVMDAVGSTRAAVMGVSEGGPLSILFAARQAKRMTSFQSPRSTLCRRMVHPSSSRLLPAGWICGRSGIWRP